MSTTLATIKKLRDQHIFSDFDVHFTQFFTTLTDSIEEAVLTGMVLTSYLTAQGHTCVDLEKYANQHFPTSDSSVTLFCPSLFSWLEALQNCPFIGAPGEQTPFILNEHYLYLYRYWRYEQQLGNFIQTCFQRPPPTIDYNSLNTRISELFPTENQGEIDWQKVAALTALLTNFCLISGGPGTGKTFTVAKILVLLLTQSPHLRIALTAPTGKAAARLKQVITVAMETLACPASIKPLIPQETYTLHRLLGSIPYSPDFQHNAENSLPYDIIVVDEASMVSLALMAKLAQATLPTARWILVGDKDQLMAIEVGTVLGDICEIKSNPLTQLTHWSCDHIPQIPRLFRLQDCIVFLEKNYRFSVDSDLGQLANAVKRGYTEQTLTLLRKASPTVKWRILNFVEMANALKESVIDGFSTYFQAKGPEDSLQALEKFRILSALRQGPIGVVALNRLIEQILLEQGLIRPKTQRWYHKQPIMITQNDYTLNLFNGETGVVLHDPNNPQTLQAFFPTLEGGLRSFAPTHLPAHETVYAMTIHKSQGSEFETVLLLLPQQFSALLSRELFYTGVTRAKKSIEIWAQEAVLRKIVVQRTQRMSQLYEGVIK